MILLPIEGELAISPILQSSSTSSKSLLRIILQERCKISKSNPSDKSKNSLYNLGISTELPSRIRLITLYLVLISQKKRGRMIQLKRNQVPIKLGKKSKISDLEQEKQLKMQNQQETSLILLTFPETNSRKKPRSLLLSKNLQKLKRKSLM